MKTCGVAPLFWRFSSGSVSASSISGSSSSLMQEKSIVGRVSSTSSLSATSCISSISLMCPVRSGVLARIVSEF